MFTMDRLCSYFHLHSLMFLNKIFLSRLNLVGRDSVVGVATRYGLGGPEIETGGGRFSVSVQADCRAPLSLLYNGYRVTPGLKLPMGEVTSHHI
jgi:hypothetical protein